MITLKLLFLTFIDLLSIIIFITFCLIIIIISPFMCVFNKIKRGYYAYIKSNYSGL